MWPASRPIPELELITEPEEIVGQDDSTAVLPVVLTEPDGNLVSIDTVEGVDDVLKTQSDCLPDQFLFGHFPGSEPFAGIEESTGNGGSLLRGVRQMLHEIA